MCSRNRLSERLTRIEQHVEAIKLQLKPSSKWVKFRRFTLTNWGFIAFWLTLVVALYAYRHYDLSYFETQKNIWRIKNSANTYVKLGDKYMLLGEIRAAGNAYRVALDIDNSNLDASRGFLRTAVFKPMQDQKSVTPEVMDATIEFLKSIETNDFIISYYEGERYEEQGKYREAKDAYEKSITQNPDFIHGYVALAFVSILNGEGIDPGMEKLNEALVRKKDSAMILNNLGFCYLAKRNYDRAIELLQDSRRISPFLEVYVNLGNAHRLKRDMDHLQEAVSNHNQALGVLDSEEDDDSDSGELAINFMPETTNDVDSPKCYAEFRTIDEKRSLVYYELSLDYALQHNWSEANQAFNRGFQLDKTQKYPDFIHNKIVALEDSLHNLDTQTRRWFNSQKLSLAPYISGGGRNARRRCPAEYQTP